METHYGKVYVIFGCDLWKTKDSMRLIMVSDADHLEESFQKIKAKFDYTDYDMKTFIYVEEVEINEII